MNILITDTTIIPMTGDQRLWFSGDIGITDSQIAYVGTVPDSFHADTIIDGSNSIVLPGLINAHNHLSMTLLRSYADDMDIFSWLHDKIWPIENRMTAEHIYHGSLLGAAEQIKSGITAFADMYFHQKQTIRAVLDAGMRANIGATFMGDEQASLQRIGAYRDLFAEYDGSGDGRIAIDIAPHAIYTCGGRTLEIASDLAAELSCRLHIHLSESLQEQADCFAAHRMSPLAYLHSLDFFKVPTYAAHCVHLSREDLELCGQLDIHAVHNPTSNLKLGNGVAPITEMLKRGMHPALGTDGASSNNNLNIFEEMHLASLIHKGQTGDPTAVSAYQVLQMATTYGAQALGIDQRTGSLEPGKDADLIMIQTDVLHLQPMHDPISAVIYAAQASDVQTVICRGKILMHQRVLQTLDEQAVIAHAVEAAEALTS
jgi:5-methylthioadenosine/S-adenosylhomocysteine deaminase